MTTPKVDYSKIPLPPIPVPKKADKPPEKITQKIKEVAERIRTKKYYATPHPSAFKNAAAKK